MGVYNWEDGRVYKGTWLQNNMHGVGFFTYEDGRRYKGQFKMDKKEGYGIYYWEDGRTFEGEWVKGKQQGIGIYKVPMQEVKFGYWEGGKRKIWFSEQEKKQIQEGSFDFEKEIENYKPSLSSIYSFKRPQSLMRDLKAAKEEVKALYAFLKIEDYSDLSSLHSEIS